MNSKKYWTSIATSILVYILHLILLTNKKGKYEPKVRRI